MKEISTMNLISEKILQLQNTNMVTEMFKNNIKFTNEICEQDKLWDPQVQETPNNYH